MNRALGFYHSGYSGEFDLSLQICHLSLVISEMTNFN